MATANDPHQNLSTLGLFIASDVRNAMQASFVTFVADRWFHQFPREELASHFRTNPANTLTYSAMNALAKQSIVAISEVLKDENKIHPIVVEIRRKNDLKLHRHAISHPATVRWDRRNMQEFADADRDVYDWQPAQIWDLQRSINDELRKHGLRTFNETLVVTEDMASNLHLILDRARLRSFAIPPVDALLAWMQIEMPGYQAALERHPDGRRDPEQERARAERKRLRNERWAAAGEQRGAKGSV